MASDDIGIARAFIAAINRRSPADIGGLMSEDHTFVDSAGRAVSGRANMTAAWKEYFQLFPDFEIKVESMLAANGLVAVFGSTSGTYNGKRGLVPANHIEMPAAWKAVVANGKVKRWQVFADWTDGLRIIDEDKKAG